MTALDVDELTRLDFDVTIPCQKREHPTKHLAHDPAVWDVRTHCPGCQQTGHYALCESGRVYMRAVTLGCRTCGLAGPWVRFIVSCLPIPEALRGAA